MKIIGTEFADVRIVELQRFGDERGWFCELWQKERYQKLEIGDAFVQDNLAYSQQGVLRGLHAQNPFAQGKLVSVYQGAVFDVAVDIRSGSPTFGKWCGYHLSGMESLQVYVPPGFAHGYYVLEDNTFFAYKCTDYYHPETQFSIRWDDAAIGIEWPLVGDPVIAEKDRSAPLLSQISAELLAFPDG